MGHESYPERGPEFLYNPLEVVTELPWWASPDEWGTAGTAVGPPLFNRACGWRAKTSELDRDVEDL